MTKNSWKYEIYRFKSRFLVFIFAIFAVSSLSGCAVFDVKELLTPEKKPSDEQVYAVYNQIELRNSDSADVLATIPLSEVELLSQSKSVVASAGQKKKGYKSWFNMVAFDENELTVTRKYIFMVDEKPKVLFVEPWTYAKFDCEMVLDSKILDEPYANDNARKIAILEQVLKNFQKDMSEVSPDNKVLATSGMVINQAIRTVLVKLEPSPALASRLSDETGLGFRHPSLDKGRIQMDIVNDVVTVKVRMGSAVKKFKVSLQKDVDVE